MLAKQKLMIVVLLLISASLACQTIMGPREVPDPVPTREPAQLLPTIPPTSLPQAPVTPGEENPDEPVFIRGQIEYTFPFFEATLSSPFVLLEDQAGFVQRDLNFEFPLEGQVIGPVQVVTDGILSYSLPLPSVPLGTWVDVDNNGREDRGVQIFAIAYWSNTWGGPFLERRDGRGWSGSYVSTIVNSERKGEIEGGILLVWAPDDEQAFPVGFGEDDKLFTNDDPAAPIPAGYTLVDLNDEPFRFYKEAEPVINLYEGSGALKDYTDLIYLEAFDLMFERVAREYPFTEQKNIDWDSLRGRIRPMVENARNDADYYLALLALTQSIPDGHVGVGFDDTVAPRYFFDNYGGGFGMLLSELSDGRVIVSRLFEGESAIQAGIPEGAEIITWDGMPVLEALDQVVPYLGPFSTSHAERLGKLAFLPRYPSDTRVPVVYRVPGETQTQQATLVARTELDSLFSVLFPEDDMALPIEANMLPGTGLAYVRINTFYDDYYLMARLFERMIENLMDLDVPGLIIDIRVNGGGSGGMASDFAAFFHDQEIEVYEQGYYNELTGSFEYLGYPSRVEPAPLHYDGKIAVLVSPDCVSACEGFAYMLSLNNRAIVVGHYPTAGAFGEVGRGQYKMPGGFSLQFPTGRPTTPEGQILIEGTGIVPDILVPVTQNSARNLEDAVLQAAIDALLNQ